MFEALVQNIESTIASRLFRVQLRSVEQQVQRVSSQKQVAQKTEAAGSIAQEVAVSQQATGEAGQQAAPAKAQGNLSDLASALKGAKATPKAQPGVSVEKIGRNEPCPCGSGLKYKKCGLINGPQHKR